MTNPLNRSGQLAECFKLMAILFYEPEMELWEQEDLLSRLAGGMNHVSSDALIAINRMRAALATIDEEQMSVDYAALFVGPFEMLAAPYGSVYLEREKRIMGDSTMWALDLYREAGLMLDVKDAPDHIAIELEFLHYLYRVEAEAVQNGDHERHIETKNLRIHFLHTCLVPWVYQFIRSIQDGTENLFYVNLATCLEVFVSNVAEYESIVITDQGVSPQEHADQSAL